MQPMSRVERSDARRGGAAGPLGARAPADVLLSADWVERWVAALAPGELRLYLHLARVAGTRTWHDPAAIAAALGGGTTGDGIERDLASLERKGLIEVVRGRGAHHYHLLCRGKDRIHRAEAIRPSIKEALEFHSCMMEELLEIASGDDSEEARGRIFERYPPLRDEYAFQAENRDSGMRRWEPWMELSLYLMNRFEERYGDLKAEHAEVFKEVSANLLRLKLEMLDKLTREVLDRRGEVFPEGGQGWIGGIAESAFVALPLVREVSKRYHVGAEQIYLNAIEALQAEGLCVVEIDARGRATDLVLPSTTGLSEAEERLVFLHVEEMTAQEVERYEETLARIRAAKEKYRRYLLRRGVEALADLARRDRVADIDALMQTIADRVNDMLDLAGEDGEDERAAVPKAVLEDVISLYDEIRKSRKMAARQGGKPEE